MTELESDGAAASVELVRRAQAGDRAALERLVERYYPRVHAIVRLRLGRHLRAHLESGDILQETFAAAVRDLDRFELRDDSSLIHWLSKIAENKIRGQRDYVQADKRDVDRVEPLDGAGGSRAFEPAGVDTSPLEHLALGEDLELLEQCLDELPEDQRELILHHYFEQADWSTVAEWTGLPSPDAARMRCRRAVFELQCLYRQRAGGQAG